MFVEGWTPSERQPLPALHGRFLAGLGDLVVSAPGSVALSRKPLDVACHPPLPERLRLYIFNCTDHPSERKAGDYRIQLRLPGQQHRQRGKLQMDSDCMVLLAGYVAEFDVFVLWDANAHAEFPYSKGIQVAAPTVHEAAIRGHSEQRRDVRGSGYSERVLAIRADRMVDGLRRREELTRLSLLGTEPQAHHVYVRLSDNRHRRRSDISRCHWSEGDPCAARPVSSRTRRGCRCIVR